MNMTLGRGTMRLALRHTVIAAAMVLILALSAGIALANNSFPLTSADKISGMKHGEKALLKGHVTPLDGSQFSFTDDSGTIPVFMTDIQWQAAHATPEDLVELYGKSSREGEAMVFKVRRVAKSQ